MLTASRRQLKFWALWTIASALVFVANPTGPFGAIEFIALLGPFALIFPQRVWRELALVIGLPLLTLIWLAEPAGTSVLRLLLAWIVFGAGVVLAARVRESQRDLESVVGRVAFADWPNARIRASDAEVVDVPQTGAATTNSIRCDIERELGRARRHDREFAVISAAVDPRTLAVVAESTNELMQTLAENRAGLELHSVLRAELHVYCDVRLVDSRVLALVPEVDRDTLDALLDRLGRAVSDRLESDVELGAALFPHDAICSEDLIDSADRMRNASKLRSLSTLAPAEQEDEAPARRTPDVPA